MTTDESNIEQQTLHTESALVRERYDRTARHYDIMTWPMEVMAMDRHRDRLIAEVEGARVLEVGVGTGRNLSLYPDAVQVDAIDREGAIRVMNALGGAAKGRDKHSDIPLRVNTVYDETRARLKVMATGSLATATGLLQLMESMSAR